MFKRSRWPDRIGMFVAIGCGVHCAALSLAFTLYPTLWLNRRYWEMGLWQKLLWLEWVLLVSAWLLVLAAMLPGWLRHRHPGPVVLAVLSLGIMTVVITTSLHFANRWMSVVTLLAGLMLASAHYWNLKLRPCRPAGGSVPAPGAGR